MTSSYQGTAAFLDNKTPGLAVRQQTDEDKQRLEELRAKKARRYQPMGRHIDAPKRWT